MLLPTAPSSSTDSTRTCRVLPVLVESAGPDGGYVGRSQFDAREIDGSVFVSGTEVEIGSIVPVRISHSFEFDLAGEVV